MPAVIADAQTGYAANGYPAPARKSDSAANSPARTTSLSPGETPFLALQGASTFGVKHRRATPLLPRAALVNPRLARHRH
jgi:hypothetical protein